jgi:hypothetical protein
MKSTDNETGETEFLMDFLQRNNDRLQQHQSPLFDMETGEVNLDECTQNSINNGSKKIKFQIPKSYLSPKHNDDYKKEREQKCCLRDTKETYTLTRKEKVINLQEVSEKVSFFIHAL